ncbi:peptidase inhibitor family I36 [Tamaricihabitans halophyticus]|uniref:Peptidase inhibitor family I36 n=1 Tax=Tamaricihabitans halophyticus TaxID=1262583 RepID=A0A4R2QH09_9PSEU|nr:peptidase inhibitor family I36 protein [Tamaricihabitans halophyticus]TCP48530.1 peptidase inhibitor family I36 [Tamaricihabitans halophyticus]
MSYGTRITTGLALIAAAMLGSAPAAQAENDQQQYRCDVGEFCLWESTSYSGAINRADLTNVNPEECAPLPEGFDGRSFVNRTDRLVTVYQDRHCATEGDFTTYPGEGTYVPVAPFVVRGIQFWN